MTIKLIVVGKTVKPYLVEGEQEYAKRLVHYTKFNEVTIPELKQASNLSEEQVKIKEGEAILKYIDTTDHLILLDEKGKQTSSVQLAKKLEQFMLNSTKQVVFVVGGAYGFSQEIYNRANETLSLSKLTFSHQMVRLFFKEQLYRAFTILKGEPYHHR